MISLQKLISYRWPFHRNRRDRNNAHKRVRSRQRSIRFETLEEKVLLATFAVIGDYGNSGAGERTVANMVKTWSPQAILTLGDNNYPVGSAATIDANIGQYYQEYIGNYRGNYGAGSPTNRFFPVLGNHDWETSGAQPYFNYFTLPGNERYYDFVLDNVHFFALDSDPNEPDGISSSSVQALWLRDGVARSQSTFKVVYFHHAPYSSGGSTAIIRWPFKQWGVNAVIAGHQHQYERLDVDDMTYIVNGLGGAEITSFNAPIGGSIFRYNTDFGAMRLVTSPTTLKFEFLSIAGGGTLVDSYTLGANGVANDNLVNATPLSGSGLTAWGKNLGATFEIAEPFNIAATGGKSVWWSWTTPSTGTVTVATAGSDFDTTLGVYAGTAINNLTKVAANDDANGSLLTSQVSFSATKGQTYRFSVDGYNGASGRINLQLQVAPAPVDSSSDSFGSRTLLVGANLSAAGDNTKSTRELGEPSNAGALGGKSVWWSWTAQRGGAVSISTAGSSFDTTLGIYTGTAVNALFSVAASDDESGSIVTSLATFMAIAGQTYQISVDGFKGASGQIRLAIVANNNFANRTAVTGTSVVITGTNIGATLETGEPKNAGATGGKSVWWSWTAPATGTVTMTTAGSTFDTALGIYSGSSLTALTVIAANDDEASSILTSRVSFTVVAGQIYQISVDGYRGSSGQIRLAIAASASLTILALGTNISLTTTHVDANVNAQSATPITAIGSVEKTLERPRLPRESYLSPKQKAHKNIDSLWGSYFNLGVNALNNSALGSGTPHKKLTVDRC